MPTQYSSLRIAAASLATGVLTVGSALPVYAAGNGSDHAEGHRAAAHHRQAAGKSSRSERFAAASAPRSGESEKGSSAHERKASESRSTSTNSSSQARARAEQPHGKANPPRHTPVTVCHLLGNGSYHLLTMDDSALKAHVGHDDIYPVPEGGCPVAPAAAPGAPAPEVGGPAPEQAAEVLPGSQVLPGAVVATEQVLGIQKEILATLGLSDTVLGVQAERNVNRAPAQVAPAAATTTRTAPPEVAGLQAAAPSTGVLPQTGAGPIGLTVAAGLALLGAGAGLLSRRRLHGEQ
jgi:LPXTG-motif cell wall-anchored protein